MMLEHLLFVALPVFVFSLWAQSRVRRAFERFSRVPTRSGLDGARVARALLDAAGLSDVRVEKVSGYLTDHYDPRSKTLRLSEATYASNSVAAVGVAAHEAGHALQHRDGYAPLQFRSAIVPVVALGSRMLPILMILALLGAFVGSGPGVIGLLFLGVLFAIAVFSLVTLPVEFDASRRALAVLEGGGVLVGDELDGARHVLRAAAFTYVAAAAAALWELLFWALQLFGSSDD